MKVGTFGGIGVYIHWTFWLLIALFLVTSTMSAGLSAGVMAVAFVMSVFACVLLHEFGHAAAAAAFGIKTSDITLLPIGGVARLTSMPERPYQELLIALAGPAVNVVIAAILFPVIALGVAVGGGAPFMGGMDFLTQLLVANIVLVAFNLLPAFPMDGGRVLRSLIAMRTGNLRATEIAARVGRWMAVAFGVYGVFTINFPLMLIAGFIFIAGTAELMAARVRAAQAAVDSGGFGPFGGGGMPFGSQARTPFGFGNAQFNSSSQHGGTTWTWRASWPPVYEEPQPGNASRTADDASHNPSRQADRPRHGAVRGGDIVDAVSVRHLT